MSRRLFVWPRADAEVEEICDYLEPRNARAAERFFDAFRAAVESIEKMPEAGGRLFLAGCDDLDLRYVRIKGFKKYFVFYSVTPTVIEVVRVLHGSRDLPAALHEE